MAENTSNLPFFSSAGRPSSIFTVADGVSIETMLECASAFLTSAIDLGIDGVGMSDSGRWALVYLAEAAKACVDSASQERDRAREAQRVMSGAAKGGAQ